MKTVLIVEPDRQVLKEMIQDLKEIDGQLDIHCFGTGKAFMGWLTARAREFHNKKHVRKKKEQGNEDQNQIDIRMIVLDHRMLKGRSLELLEIIHQKILEIGMTDEEKPFQFLVTAYEDSDFSRNDFIHPLIFNVIFKPVDSLLLNEAIKLTLKGIGPISSDLYTHDTQAEVEILKDITTIVITELGFRTLSQTQIPLGKKARYYSELFEANGVEYVFAFCYNNRPSTEHKGKFESSFSYFGISKDQLGSIRRHIRESKNNENLPLLNASNESDESLHHEMILVSSNGDVQRELFGSINDRFINISQRTLPSVGNLIETFRDDLGIELEKVKFLPSEDTYEILFNKSCSKIIGVNGPEGLLDDAVEVLGHTVKKITESEDFFKIICNPSDHAMIVRIIADKNVAPGSYFKVIDNDENYSIIEVTGIIRALDEKQRDIWALSLSELDEARQKEVMSVEGININRIDAVFFNMEEVYPRTLLLLREFCQKTKERGTQTRFFALSKRHISSYDDLEKYEFFDDFLCLPIDNFYLSRKMKQLFPAWPLKDGSELGREGIHEISTIQTALPVSISKVSETHISLYHTRALKIGDIRRFVLFMDNETDIPEIWGKCNNTTPESKDKFLNEFLFFGVKDRHLKYIRKWIKALYIKSKSGS